jgi:Concanavalin A-like lectin/glucanases superfamily
VKDVLHQNYPTTTGTPSLLTGSAAALTDGNAALRLSSTDTWVVTDSASSSLAVADAAAGGAAMTGWFSLPSLPGSTQTILGKVGSYELKVTSAGKLQWIITNGANSVTVTSTATISTGTWYHFAGVYNGDYTGATIFGNQSSGSTTLSMPADYHMGAPQASNLNLQACKFTALEKGVVTSVVIDLRRAPDATLYQNVKAVVYGPGTASNPGAYRGASDGFRFDPTTLVPGFISFPTSAPFYAGDVWLGWTCGGSNGNSGQLEIGTESSGGARAARAASYADPPYPYGTATTTDAKKFAIYANYTATGRTGDEGNALIYLNGVQDAISAYAHGIADTANNLQHPAGVAVDLDDWAIWNKKLTAVQVATHYAAR